MGLYIPWRRSRLVGCHAPRNRISTSQLKLWLVCESISQRILALNPPYPMKWTPHLFLDKNHDKSIENPHDFAGSNHVFHHMTSIWQQDMLANYIERLMNKCLDELIRSGCIELKEAQQAPQGAVNPQGAMGVPPWMVENPKNGWCKGVVLFQTSIAKFIGRYFLTFLVSITLF